MNYCTITPDRGDRPALLENCRRQVEMINIISKCSWYQWPLNFILENNPPVSKECDIVPRVRHAVARARREGFTWAFIIENDDFYPSNYISNLFKGESFGQLPEWENYDFIGYQNTFYYNIKTRRYQRMEHETHSSLFCTGFRLSALDDFQWPPDDNPFLDIALWKHAKQKHRWKLLREENPCVGIKGHGMGKMGGKGHRLELNRADPEMKWFRAKLNDEKAFEFYKSIV